MDIDENAEINDSSDERMAVRMYKIYPLQSNQLLNSTVFIQNGTIGKGTNTTEI